MIKGGLGGVRAEFFGEPDEESFGAADVAEAVDVFVLNDFVDEFGAKLVEAGQGIIQVLDGEHDPQVAKGVDGSVAVVGSDGRRFELGKFEPAVAIGGDHHGNLTALVAQAGDSPGPFSLNYCSSLEVEAEFSEEGDDGVQVFNDDADVVHSFDCHVVSLVVNYGLA